MTDYATLARDMISELCQSGYTVEAVAGELTVAASSESPPMTEALADRILPLSWAMTVMLESANVFERIRTKGAQR